MALFTVSITGVVSPVEVYGGLTNATDYIGAMIGDAYTAWRALTADDMKRTLVAATRYIDEQDWQGTANAFGGTTLQWPRDSVLKSTGVAYTNAEELALIQQAAFELAAAAADDPDVFSAIDASSNIQAVTAGGAGVTFFNPTSIRDGSATKLPPIVMRLIGKFLAAPSASSAAFGSAGGEAEDSIFGSGNDMDRGEPF